MYNDHFGVLPSEIIEALSKEYHKAEETSQKATDEQLSSTLQLIKKLYNFSFNFLNDFPLEIKNIITQIKDNSKKWEENITNTFKFRQTENVVEEFSDNLFEFIDSLVDLIQSFLKLIKIVKPSSQKLLLDFAIEGNNEVHELTKVLKFKNIKIHKYI